jgi:UDP-N-acetylglucosamine 4,6-dehydratase
MGNSSNRGELKISSSVEYSSENTVQLDVENMKHLLMKLPFVRALREGRHVNPEA